MRRKKVEWIRIVEQFQKSGLTIKRFSAQKDIGEQSLRNWSRKLGRESSAAGDSNSGFVEIPIVDAPVGAVSAMCGISIRFGTGITIEVSRDSDRGLLAWVFHELGKAQ